MHKMEDIIVTHVFTHSMMTLHDDEIHADYNENVC